MQPTRWDFANIATDWGDTIMTREIRISELSVSRIAVHGRYYITHPFFFLEKYAPTINFCYSIDYGFYSVSYTLFLTFNFFWFLSSNKTWLSERFPLVSKYELLLLEQFLFYFKSFYICTRLSTFILIIIIIMIIFVIIVFIIFIAITVSSLSMLLSFFIFKAFHFKCFSMFYLSSFYSSILSLCILNIFKF